MTALQPVEEVTIPESHRDLLERPICGVLTTLLPDGQPHSCLVRVDHDGRHARVNTTLQRQGGRDMIADPRVSLLVVDPDDTSRFIQIRGRAEMVTEGAGDHLDALTRRYTRHPRLYGFVYPAEAAMYAFVLVGAMAAGGAALSYIFIGAWVAVVVVVLLVAAIVYTGLTLDMG